MSNLLVQVAQFRWVSQNILRSLIHSLHGYRDASGVFGLGLYTMLLARASPGPPPFPRYNELGDRITPPLRAWSLLESPWYTQGHAPKSLEGLKQQLLVRLLWQPCLDLFVV